MTVTFWIIALHLLYKLWISNILATSITEETCIVEMRIWCKKIDTVNFIMAYGSLILKEYWVLWGATFFLSRRGKNH